MLSRCPTTLLYVLASLAVALPAAGPHADGLWCAMTLPPQHMAPAAAELVRFITTPRAIQAMLRGRGVNISHFRPSVHVTLWN